jgi:hypothetical protein
MKESIRKKMFHNFPRFFLFGIAYLIFAFHSILDGQSNPLSKLADQANALKRDSHNFEYGKKVIKRTASLRAALKEWIESELPNTKTELATKFNSLESELNKELKQKNLLWTESSEMDYGSVSVGLKRLAEAPDSLLLIAGVTVPCGTDDTVYLYRFDNHFRFLAFEDHIADFATELIDFHISSADESGKSLLLITRDGVQCGSWWNSLWYSLYQLNHEIKPLSPVLSERQSIYFGDDTHIKLDPHDLLMEFADRSIDSAIGIRKHVLHYQIVQSKVSRVEPYALDARDFADEWISRPWQEMKSCTSPQKLQSMEQWHKRVYGVESDGYCFIKNCPNKANLWTIAVHFNEPKKKKLNDICLFFRVEQTGPRQYKMMDINTEPYPDCPGEDSPTIPKPDSLFGKEK